MVNRWQDHDDDLFEPMSGKKRRRNPRVGKSVVGSYPLNESKCTIEYGELHFWTRRWQAYYNNSNPGKLRNWEEFGLYLDWLESPWASVEPPEWVNAKDGS